MQPLVTIFDLDGVLIDNLAFECAVTDCLVAELALKRGITRSNAEALWEVQLKESVGHARECDYSYHCEVLGLGELYREAHWASGHALNVCEGIEKVVEFAQKRGECWIATDATGWVTTFKLQTLHVPPHLFSEILHSTFCAANKGMSEYWTIVRTMLEARAARGILIDNRIDRLEIAKREIPELSCILVDADDHVVGVGKKRSSGICKTVGKQDLLQELQRVIGE